MYNEPVERAIKEDTFYVLRDIGVECVDKRIIEKFESTQMAAYDPTTQRIHILPDLVKACIDTTPKRFPIMDYSFGGGGVAAYIKRGDDYIVPTSEIHVSEIMKMAEENNIPFMFKSVSPKFNISEENKQIDIIRNYYSGYLYLRAETRVGLKKCREEYERTGKICTTHSPIASPLKFSNNNKFDTYQLLLETVNYDLPVYLTSMPITCLTGPSTLYGITLQAHCEFLAGLCLVQILRPGLTVVNGAFPAAGNPLKWYLPALGSIYHNLANWMTSKISFLDSIPSIQSGCTISGVNHNPIEGGTDIQTEKGFKLWNSLNNWHQVRHCFGFIDTLTAIDMDKMQRDMVSLNKIKENNEQLKINYDNLGFDKDAVDVIQKGVEFDDFRGLKHTTDNIGILDYYENL